MSSPGHLLLNAYPVTPISRTLRLRVGLYPGDEGYKSLLEKYSEKGIFKRKGNELEAVPLVEDFDWGEIREEPVGHHLLLIARLLEFLTRLLVPKNRIEHSSDGLNILGSEDLLDELCKDLKIKLPIPLHIRPLYSLQYRMERIRGEAELFLVIQVKFAYLAPVSVHQTFVAGVNVLGHYCKVPGRLIGKDTDNYSLAGRIESISGEYLKLSDARNITVIKAREAIIEPKQEYILNILETAAQGISWRSKLERIQTGYISGKGQLQYAKRIVGWLSQQFTKTGLSPIKFSLDTSPLSLKKEVKNSVYSLPQVQFVFDPAGTRTNPFPLIGLNQFGPFDRTWFSKRSPKLAFIAPKALQGRAEVFLNKFLEGQPTHSSNYPPYSKGFASLFNLTNIDVSYAWTEAWQEKREAYKTYLSSARDLLERDTSSLRVPPIDLAVIMLPDDIANLPDRVNPYLHMKRYFMTHGIPVQQLRQSNAVVGDYELGYTLANIALSCYAKLSGTPWVIASDRTVAHEFVIGIASSYVGDERLSERKRLVGMTTLFTGDGNYQLSNLTDECDYEIFEDVLCNNVKQLLEDCRTDWRWKANDRVRLIFHLFQPLKGKIQERALQRAVEALGAGSLEIAFVWISKDPPWLCIDPDEKGKRGKGEYVPQRGTVVRLDNFSRLLVSKGPAQLKRDIGGHPLPLHIRLLKNSTFTDIDYITEQALKFTGMSWRSTQPSPIPVTMLYSNLIAKLLGRLSKLDNWSPEPLRSTLKQSRWFL